MNDPNDMLEEERNAKMYFHGTGKRYYEKMIAKYGHYENEYFGGSIFVGLSEKNSCNYARSRSEEWNDKPILLRIDGDAVRGRVHVHATVDDLVIDFLEEGEYELVEL